MSGIASIKTIMPMAVSTLLNKNYFIRSYQRGYRWGSQQVQALLDDIETFPQKGDSWYCLQPLVVKEVEADKKQECNLDTDKMWYEVIDGQQRLTTIFLIIHYFNQMWEGDSKIDEPVIKYETRPGSEIFLKGIKVIDDKVNIENDNIDYYHISNAFGTIHDWVKEKKGTSFDRDKFKSKFKEYAKVIWYINNKEDPTTVFTRLNIGKIPLTNAELVKALFLSGETMKAENAAKLNQYKDPSGRRQAERFLGEEIKLRQLKIASEWDMIEKQLNDKDFWAFLTNENPEEYPTKIEFLLKMPVKEAKTYDDYAVFNYYDSLMNSESKTATNIWEGEEQKGEANRTPGIVEVFETIREWYTNRNYYHLTGFLIEQNIATASKIFSNTRGMGKSDFVAYLKKEIKENLKHIKDIEALEYTDNSGYRILKYILTLFNILTVNNIKDDSQRYPFALHKVEKWSLEHIHAQNSEKLKTKKEWQDWLREHGKVLPEKEKNAYLIKEIDNALETLDDKSKGHRELFLALSDKITKLFREEGDGEEVHTIENMALISFEGNSSLNNSAFAVKRQKILEMDKKGEYIPICTKNVFFRVL
jgi:hypothetical protein